jgi:gamma-glutamylcyclotransferase
MQSLYFAYASNMDERHLRAHCPTAGYVDIGCLDGHRLAFTRRSVVSGTGVADVVPAPDDAVWGVLYELDDVDLDVLDRKEGNGWAYARGQKRIMLGADRSMRGATIYTVLAKEPNEVPPSHEYLERLLLAAQHHGLPGDYLTMLRAIPSVG